MESKSKVFLDTDVVLDHLADRQPFAEYAHRIFGFAELGAITLCVSALTFSNLYYILRKLNGHEGALALLEKLKHLVAVSAVGETEINEALSSKFRDFEDAIQHFAARNEGGVAAIITRNDSDFAGSLLPILSPEQLVENFWSSPTGE